MPERPELEYVVGVLSRELPGAEITAAEVLDPVVLRIAIPGDLRALLTGRRIQAVSRRAHFVIFTLDGERPLELAIHPMLAGRFSLVLADPHRTRDTALVLTLHREGRPAAELRYRDDKQMGKVWLIQADQRATVPGLTEVGVDVLSEAFTRDAFRNIARKRRDQAKNFLLDKTALDALGNAYADEALFEAGVHPKARVSSLPPATIDRLHDAIVSVLRHAIDEVARRGQPIDEKVRDFLKVRNRKGQPCPRCGSPIRVAGVNGHDAFFCAVCQPDEQGRGFVGWRPPVAP